MNQSWWCFVLLVLAVPLLADNVDEDESENLLDRMKRASGKNYGLALGKSLAFYDAQRSGDLTSNFYIKWRSDSGMNDCVRGGWYDAGDHVKFGLPMASSTTMLLWSLNQFRDGYQRAGKLTKMYDTIKWPLDYFLKAWNPSRKELVVQVGDGNADHAYWGRAEDMKMHRPCKKVSTKQKGSDIAGETAAALAAGSVAFKKKGDSNYANKLLNAAKSLYSFAKNHRGIFYGASPFYKSSNDRDELCLAAMWLHKATGNKAYLNDARYKFDAKDTAWALSWDEKKVACQILLYQATKDNSYKRAVENFLNSWGRGGGIQYTPCGLAWRDKWGSNRYAGNTAFAALVAAELGMRPWQYRKFAVEQINYLLGDNHVKGGCFSFQVGYGRNFPRQPHHRGASCPSKPASCGDAQQRSGSPNPHVLQGALVGGPDAYDNYNDKRSDYIANEVATDYNAGFQGALAGILHLQRIGKLPTAQSNCKCN